MHTRHIPIAFLLFFFISLPATAQLTFFERTFGGPGSDIPEAVRQLADGTIFLVGHSDSGGSGAADISLVRLDRYGNQQWIKYYGTALNDYGLGMAVLSDGNLVLVGETNSAATGIDAIVIKVDTAGNEIWRRIFSTNVNESLRSITQTIDGGFIACGFQNDSYNSNDSYVLKLDSSGNLQWQKTIGGIDNDYANTIKPVANGGYIMTADTKSFGAGGYDVELIRMDNQGTVQWDSAYGNAFQNGCQGMIITAAGKYLSFGETEIYNGSPYNFFMQLIDTNGVTIWKKVFGGPGTDAIFEVVETPGGDFVCTGYSNHGNTPLDLIVMQTDSAATIVWQQLYGTPYIDIGYDMVASIDNGYLITGKTFTDDDQYYLLHVNQQGLVGIPSQDAHSELPGVYPNPSNGVFYFTFPSAAGRYDLSIYAQDGRLVRNLVCTGGNTQVELPGDLPKGIYTAKVTDGKNRWYTKLALF